jgi:predicted ABC-type ATPase
LNQSPVRSEIIVVAGPNGAGKSSIGGEALRGAGVAYYNPDEAARAYREIRADATGEDANDWAWHTGKALLERAVEQRLRFAFETTLGGRTIPGLLLKAANVGLPVRVWYIGLASAELHLQRVRARVRRGGHGIPENKIRERYDSSRQNLIRLLPHLTELKLYDNSQDYDLHRGEKPLPLLILHLRKGRVVDACTPSQVPDWAKPIVQAALDLFGPGAM